MKWQFTTSDAPQQNGCSEAMVKTVKKALKKAIGDTLLTPFELYTCLLEGANLVNQRPIRRIPNDPDDGTYLCPNDILLGRASITRSSPRSIPPYGEPPSSIWILPENSGFFLEEMAGLEMFCLNLCSERNGMSKEEMLHTATWTYMRPIAKICMIYPAEDFPE